MKAYWTEGVTREIVSANQLDELIHEVRGQKVPTMVFLEHDCGTTLVFGVGAGESILTYVDGEGRTFHSIGDVNRSGVLKFWCRDQPDDFLAEMAIPEAVAIDAAHRYREGGTRPENVEWEADW